MSKKYNIKKAIYSGTFDPFTKGHMCILKQGLKVYDKIIIAVATSKTKKPMFDINTRISFIQSVTKGYKGVTVVPFDNLLANFAKENNVYNIIRGIRDIKDFEYEKQIAYANNMLDSRLQTNFFLTSQKYSHISSSLIRELISFDTSCKGLVPKKIYNQMKLFNI